MKILEKIKELIGEDFEKYSEKLGSLEGEYIEKDKIGIPKDRFDEVNNKYKEMKESNNHLLTQINKIKENPEIENYKNLMEGLKTQLEEKENAIQDYENKIIERNKNDYLNTKFSEFGVQDSDYIKFKLGNDLEFKDGKIEGLENKLTELKEDPNMLKFFTNESIKGFEEKQQGSKVNTSKVIRSAEDIKNMTHEERIRRMDEIDSFLANNN